MSDLTGRIHLPLVDQLYSIGAKVLVSNAQHFMFAIFRFVYNCCDIFLWSLFAVIRALTLLQRLECGLHADPTAHFLLQMEQVSCLGGVLLFWEYRNEFRLDVVIVRVKHFIWNDDV